MRVTLISTHPEVLSIGPRSLSACLRRAGHEVRLLILPGDDFTCPRGRRYLGEYPPAVLAEIVELCRDSGLVGISLLTNSYYSAVTLTRALRAELDVPVVWGGPHPTARPEQCLEHAQLVCRGESEEALVELAGRLAAGGNGEGVANVWRRRNGEIEAGEIRPLIQELDSLPFPDCDLLGQPILHEGRLVALDAALLQRYSFFRAPGREGITYLVLTSRGCPHKCGYCANDMWRRLYPCQKYVRRRSIEAICDELEHARARIPGIAAVNFADDNFPAQGREELEAALETYERRIGLPFSCTLSPIFADEARLALLARHGCYRISMGIQSGSERILGMYKRQISVRRAREAVARLEAVRPALRPPATVSYHFIVDNPYETAEDKIATLEFILGMPRRDSFWCFSLLPFPGTRIHEMMQSDGLITDEHAQIFTKDITDLQPSFTRHWLNLYHAGAPKALLRFLLRPGWVRWLDGGRPRQLRRALHGALDLGYRGLGALRRAPRLLRRG